MSVATAITDLQGRVEDAYDALEAKGAIIPATKNTANMPSTIATIQTAKPEQSKTVTPTAGGLTVTPDSGKVLSSVVVNGDADLVAENIKKDVEIFGVTGSYEGGGGGLQGYTLTINADTLISDQPACYAFAISDGSIIGINTAERLYRDGQIILNDVVSYVGFLFDDPSTPVVLTGDTTVSFFASCLLAGTLITLANGTQKKIEDITFDDELLVWDFDKACLTTSKPLWVKKAQTVDYMYKIKFASGNSINVTGPKGHRAFNIDESKFIYLIDSVGQKVKTIDGEDEVVSCEKKTGEFDFYNIITDRHFNMFANGILTSCRLNNYRKFDGMTFAESPKVYHSKDDFKGIPESYIEGLCLCEQPIDAEELNAYVRRLLTNAK